jgi:hypothetical protein
MLGNAACFKSETQNALGQVLSFSTATFKWTLHKTSPYPQPSIPRSIQEGFGVRLPSTCFSAAMICASVCRLLLIRFSPFLRPNRIRNWTDSGGQVTPRRKAPAGAPATVSVSPLPATPKVTA